MPLRRRPTGRVRFGESWAESMRWSCGLSCGLTSRARDRRCSKPTERLAEPVSPSTREPLRGRPPGPQTNQPRVDRRKDVGCRPPAANVLRKQCGNVGRPQRSPGKRGFKAVNIRAGPRKDLLQQADFGRPVLLCRTARRHFSSLNSELVITPFHQQFRTRILAGRLARTNRMTSLNPSDCASLGTSRFRLCEQPRQRASEAD
jgi:hypothetical protein